VSDEEDLLYSDAVQLICAYGSYSSQLLQRRLHIGYWQARLLLDMMREDELLDTKGTP
jgi:DNA segregation ATPase FtsK/SpoIIIE-like protein